MKTVGEIIDPEGTNRLQLRFVQLGEGWDFHSLVWQTRAGGRWRAHAVISRDAFQAGRERERWVSALHRFDPENGRAIIKVAEGDEAETALRIHYVYSWREWDLVANTECRLLRVCTNPFEPFETS